MPIINQERSKLINEIDKLKSELKEIHYKYDLFLESSKSYFIIFKSNEVAEFSPKAEEKFVFSNDFIDKTVEELMPIFQPNGEESKKTWAYNIKKLEHGSGTPFEFEFIDKNGKSFMALCTISVIKDKRHLAHLDISNQIEQINSNSATNTIVDHAPVFIRMSDVQNKVNYFNKGWIDLLDIDPNEIFEKWAESIHPDDRLQYLSALNYAVNQKKKYEYSFRVKNKLGEYRWLLDTGVPRFSKNNKFIGYSSAAIDTTDRKNLELETTRDEAILASEKKIQESLNTSEVVALTTDTEGNISFCNAKLIKLLKIQKHQIIGNNLFDIFISDRTTKINAKMYRQMAKDATNAGPILGKFFFGNDSDIEVRFNVIFLRDALNEVSRINLLGENITEQQIVKKQLERTNDQLKELFDNSYDLIQTFDQDGYFQFVNIAWTEKLGYANKTSQIKFKDIVSPDHWDQAVESLDKIIKGENVERFETVLLSDRGKKIFVSGRVNCSFELNGRVQFRGIFYDITERIRAEKAQSLYYKIVNYNIEGLALDILYNNLFDELNNILVVQNISILIKSEDKDIKPIPFFKTALTSKEDIEDQKYLNKKLGELLLKKSKAQILSQEEIREKILVEDDFFGDIPKVWLGVPITVGNHNKGFLSIHSYQDRSDYNHKDLELLFFISTQISLAIEKKQNEDKIKDQAARLKAIFESSSHQIWSVGRSHQLTSYNNQFSTTIKKSYHIDIKNGQLVDSKELDDSRLKSELWTQSYTNAFEGKPVHFEHESISQDHNTPIWTEVFINPIVKNNGSIHEVSVIANDITEKKNSEIALVESESKFREIFESIQDIYFRCDLKGTISMISPSAHNLKLKEPYVIGNNIKKYFTSEVSPRAIIKELLIHKKIQNLQGSLKKGQSNQDFYFICNIRLLYREEHIIGIEGVARDITELRKASKDLQESKEIAENSLAVKERFLANMSHEIRTPMNGIIGMIDLIGSTQLDKEQFEYIKTIKKSSETLMVILNDILDLSKIEAGKMKLKLKPVRLNSTFEKLYDLFSQQAYNNKTCIYYHLTPEISDWVMLDETRLLQVLSNLTSNAIKFSKDKGTINVSLIKLNDINGEHQFKVQIKDEGIGITKEQINELFINFNQLDNSSTKTYSGTGLGLAISKELVQSMGGKIGVASTPGLGSTFWFTFNAGIVSEQKGSYVNEETLEIHKEFTDRSPRIMVVDDNKVNRTVAEQILLKSGCDVQLVESGFEAIKQVKNKHFDLIFMDIQMPEMDGIQTTQQIKSLGLKNCPPIVAMTAYSMEDDEKRFIAAGLDGYVAKPIKAKTIINMIKQHLSYELKELSTDILDNKTQALIINQNTINQLSKYGGQELIISVLSDFEKETKLVISNCFAYLETNDIEEIRKELHTLKGSSGTLGVEVLEERVTKLEKQLKTHNTSNLKEQLDRIVDSYREFQENYKNII